MNKKILVYNNFKWIKNIHISVCSYPRDIITQNNKIFILDDSGYIFETDSTGTIQEFQKLPDELKAHQISKLSFENDDSLILHSVDGAYVCEEQQWQKIDSDL